MTQIELDELIQKAKEIPVKHLMSRQYLGIGKKSFDIALIQSRISTTVSEVLITYYMDSNNLSDVKQVCIAGLRITKKYPNGNNPKYNSLIRVNNY